MQNGPRGRREREFYERVRGELRAEKAARLRAAEQTAVSEEHSDDDEQASISGRSDDDADSQANLPFSVRNAAMLAAVPRFCEFPWLALSLTPHMLPAVVMVSPITLVLKHHSVLLWWHSVFVLQLLLFEAKKPQRSSTT